LDCWQAQRDDRTTDFQIMDPTSGCNRNSGFHTSLDHVLYNANELIKETGI